MLAGAPLFFFSVGDKDAGGRTTFLEYSEYMYM